MLNYLDVVPLLSAACTTFSDSPEAAAIHPMNGAYLQTAQLARHMIRLLDAGEVGDFSCVFGVVEWILTEGDVQARRLVNDGFMDDLFNPGFYAAACCSAFDFVEWLGRRARRHPRVRSLSCD
jgi:hypothetical protein